MKHRFIYSIIFLLSGVFAKAQPHSHEPSDSLHKKRDTIPVTYCYAQNHTAHLLDTLPLDVHLFNRTEKQDIPYAFLGNVGSPHTPLVYAPVMRTGFDLGLHQYDLYLDGHEKIRFYSAQHAASDAFYSQAGTQLQSTLYTRLARSFGPHWSATFRYDMMNQKGMYAWQAVRHTHLSLALRYRSTNDKYQFFFSGIDNTAKAQHNSGIQNAAYLDPAIGGTQRDAVPVNSTSAVDTQHVQSVQIAQFLKITKGFEASHTAEYHYERYTFLDSYSDSANYHYQNFIPTQRYNSTFTTVKSLQNTFLLQSPTDSVKRLSWAAGVRHGVFWVYQEPNNMVYQNLFAIGKLKVQPFNALTINAEAQFGLFDRNAGDLNVHGEADLNLNKIGRINAHVLLQRYSPTLFQERMMVNYRPVWQNTFQASNEFSFGANYTLPLKWLQLKGGIENHTISQFIYYDERSRPKQAPDALNIAQIKADVNLNFSKFHLDNQLILQNISNQNYLRLPAYYTMHRLYWQGGVFKNKLKLNTGFDVRLMDSYYAQAYNPLFGQFYIQNKEKLSFYPAIDFHTNFIIDKFDGFIKLENIYNAVSPTREVYYAAPGQPMRDFHFRFGILWRFLE